MLDALNDGGSRRIPAREAAVNQSAIVRNESTDGGTIELENNSISSKVGPG